MGLFDTTPYLDLLNGKVVTRAYADSIRAVVADAPPLTREQITKISVLMRDAWEQVHEERRKTKTTWYWTSCIWPRNEDS